MAILGDWGPPSLTEAAQELVARSESSISLELKPASWLLVLRVEQHYLYADTAADAVVAPIFVYRHGEPPEPLATSLQELIELWLEAFRYGMHWDEQYQLLVPDDYTRLPPRVLRSMSWFAQSPPGGPRGGLGGGALLDDHLQGSAGLGAAGTGRFAA